MARYRRRGARRVVPISSFESAQPHFGIRVPLRVLCSARPGLRSLSNSEADSPASLRLTTVTVTVMVTASHGAPRSLSRSEPSRLLPSPTRSRPTPPGPPARACRGPGPSDHGSQAGGPGQSRVTVHVRVAVAPSLLSLDGPANSEVPIMGTSARHCSGQPGSAIIVLPIMGAELH